MPSMVWVRSVSKKERAVDYLILRIRAQLHKRLAPRCAAIGVQLVEPVAVKFLLIGIGARECKIDIIDDIRVGRAGLPGRAWH
jgi:hypothetical protein